MHCSRVDAFRHRADPIIADHARVSHVYPGLTLIRALERVPRDKGHPPWIVADIEMRARGGKS